MAQTGAIEAQVWDDRNANVVYEPATEPGLSGVTVELYDGSNNYLTFAVTDASGIAKFKSLNPGTYKLKFIPLRITHKTSQNIEQDNKSDANPSGGWAGFTGSFTVAADETVEYVDAGL